MTSYCAILPRIHVCTDGPVARCSPGGRFVPTFGSPHYLPFCISLLKQSLLIIVEKCDFISHRHILILQPKTPTTIFSLSNDGPPAHDSFRSSRKQPK